MSIPIPLSKPKARLNTVMDAARAAWSGPGPLPEFFVFAVRGYYDKTISPPGNNLNAYDDAFFIVSPLGFDAYNGNTDPTRYGWNDHAGKYMARLAIGCWKMIYRMHRGKYWAFGQGDFPVKVERITATGTVKTTETGCFGIDLHLGGENGTSSEGCLTVPPSQWYEFRDRLRGTMELMELRSFDLILIDGPIC